MKKTGIILSAIIILFSCQDRQDGDDAAVFNNTNETVIEINVPNSFSFDRLNIPVRVNFYDNPNYSGAITCSRSLMMTKSETDEDGKSIKIPTTSASSMSYDLLEPGDYYAFAYLDMNKNSKYDSNEPKKEIENKIHVLKESRRTLKFNF